MSGFATIAGLVVGTLMVMGIIWIFNRGWKWALAIWVMTILIMVGLVVGIWVRS